MMIFKHVIGVGMRRWIFLLPAAMICCAAWGAETPLYQEDPYDVVTLKQPGENQTFKVLPLDLPVRKVPEDPRPNDEFQLRKLEEPDKTYRVFWKDVKDVDFFEQRVLQEARDRIAAGKFEEAYDYFTFLDEHYPKMPGLKTAWVDYLYDEAKSAYGREEYDAALALLREANARDAQRPDLKKALGMTADKLAERYLAVSHYATVRRLIEALRSADPEHPVVAAWTERLRGEAEKTFREAEAAARAGDWAAADRQSRLASTIWPAYPGARELAESVHRRFPRVVVGVSTPWSPHASNRLADEGLRRTARLCYRTLTEYLGPGSEGGRYRCPLGEIRMTALGRKLLVLLKPDVRFDGNGSPLTGYDLARQLREMAAPGDPAFNPVWSELLQRVAVQGVYQVEAEFHRPAVRPEALLQIPVVPQGTAAPRLFEAPVDGPFLVPVAPRKPAAAPPSPSDAETTFTSNPHYFAAQPGQPRQVVERHYFSSVKAIRDLKEDAIQAADRIVPWELPRLQTAEELAVGRYAVPRVHCLVPNLSRPLLGQRAFRRALVYGINREAILKQLLGDQTIEGCCIVSGPFPAGTGPDDPLSYAYDDQIAPRPYDPRLALALVFSESAVARREMLAKKNEGDAEEAGEAKAKTDQPAAKKKSPPSETLVLAYPDDELAQTACESIKKQLSLIGLKITLRPLSGPFPRQVPPDADLLYAALYVGEPATDAEAIFGETGLTGGGSPYLRLALNQLSRATDWKQVQNRLHYLHRLAHEEAAIIPLWQLYDFYAYRKGLHGVGERPATLYQNVEQWQVPFQYPTEKE